MEKKHQPDDDRTVMAQVNEATAVNENVLSTLGDNALPAGAVLGEFEITGLIGVGGFGIVYLAYDHSLHRKVALKEYMPSGLASREGNTTVVRSSKHEETFQAGLRSFINEARLLAQFDHPSLVKVHQFWEANGTAYMVMPFYDGKTLKETLKENGGQIDEVWLKHLLEYLLDALELIHRDSCFHRDIAPDNILILNDGRPLLLDFGAARRVISNMTQNITVILKPGYAPIEQYAEVKEMKQGAWTDIYALAAVVYFAVTGKVPVQAVSRIISDTLEPLAKLKHLKGFYSPAFLLAIDKALAVKPEDRPQDTIQLRGLLGLKHASDSTSGNSTKLIKSKRDFSLTRHGLGVVVLIALVSGGWYFLQQHSQQMPALKELEKDIVDLPEPAKNPALSLSTKTLDTSDNREEEDAQSRLLHAPNILEKSLELDSEQVIETKMLSPVDHPTKSQIEAPVKPEKEPEKKPEKPEPARMSKLPSHEPELILPKKIETKRDYFFGSDMPLIRGEQEARPPKSINMPSPTVSDRREKRHFLSQSLLEETIMDHLLDGKVCLNMKNYACAITEAKAVLRLEPSNMNAKKILDSASAEQEKAQRGTNP